MWPQWPLLAEIQGPRSLEKSQAKSLEHRGALRIHPAGGALRRAVRDAPVPAGRVARWGAGKEGCPAPEHFLLASHALGVWRSAHLCSGVRRRHLYRSRDSPVPIGTPALLGLSAVVRVIAWVCAPITRLRTWLAMHAFRLLHHRSVHTPSALSAAECCSVAMMLYGTPHRSTAAFQRRTGIVRTLGIIQPPAVTAPPILIGPTAMPCISHYPPSA